MTAHNFLFISAATTYAIAFLLYIVTITDDLKRCLNSINGEAKKKKKNRQYILQQLKVFIQLHSMARQLSKRCNSLERISLYHTCEFSNQSF